MISESLPSFSNIEHTSEPNFFVELKSEGIAVTHSFIRFKLKIYELSPYTTLHLHFDA